MRTFEMLIVFSALVAIVALVAIGLDWAGRPLRHRRFVPRMYRFEDEMLPEHRPGRPGSEPPAALPAGPPQLAIGPAPSRGPRRRAPSRIASDSPFSDHVFAPADTVATAIPQAAPPAASGHSRIATATTASPRPSWSPGMPLDARVADRKPTIAIKAERYWQTVASAEGVTHFDAENLARMTAGKPPQRFNPRRGRHETMQLVGLRRASNASSVRMRWAGEAVDPWSSS